MLISLNLTKKPFRAGGAVSSKSWAGLLISGAFPHAWFPVSPFHRQGGWHPSCQA